jgi:hypothetical protein
MRILRSSLAAALAATVALTAVDIGAAQAAPANKPQAQAATLDLSARKRHYHRHYRNDRAALQMFGMVAGTITGIAAAEQSRRYYRRGYGYDDYYDGYPPPAYYGGYGPYYRY